MRDTSDMTEDALSEDTMMDCAGDGGGLDDFVELATDIADSSRTIRDAAERLLTLLGVEDDNDDSLFSSEDEGVEVDVDDDEDDDDNDDDDDDDEDEEQLQNTRLLHQLAASLAQELKYSQQNDCLASPSTRIPHQQRVSFDDECDHSVEMVQETNFFKDSPYLRDHPNNAVTSKNCERNDDEQPMHLANGKYSFGYSLGYRETPQMAEDSFESEEAPSPKDWDIAHLDSCFRMQSVDDERSSSSGSWASGWDACAAEALRYLVEDEGLPPHHPTVLAMKNHLRIQRERVIAQYAA